MRRILPKNSKRVVVKIGTSALTGKNYQLNKTRIKKLVEQIAYLVNKDMEVILVTSGAIAAGMGMLGLTQRPRLLPQLQAAAAIGQSQLMRIYDSFFKDYKLVTAQILLTREDLSSRRRYLNAKNTLLTLLSYKAIPIINENDTVSVAEIKFGDNDQLSALVANLVHADLLIILSDVEGLYAQSAKTKAFSKQALIPTVEKITPEIAKIVKGSSSKMGTGGMISKLEAAKICSASGLACIIANGKTADILPKVLAGQKIGTLFLPGKKQLVAKKRWIGFSAAIDGQIFVDKGARGALTLRKKSLLAKGIVNVKGIFKVGDTVSILDMHNQEFARGLTNYSSTDLGKIKGKRSDQIRSILGYKYYDEVIHRDNLVIL